MLGTMMLPLHVRLIPQYIMYNSLGWVDTYVPLILPAFLATNGFFIFLLTQYMRGLPHELDEAATVDGCGSFRLFIHIITPLSLPAIITVSIFSFIWTWNDFFSQMIYINNMHKYTVSLALRMFVDALGNSSWGALFAMSTLSLIPLFAMFIGFQTYLVEGITAGSIKG
jgi:multiple sugar transport system permease protein